ncbi:unnamed protein product [Sphagnum jensenii]|uniref:Uncharacterized protein n=1 Tax=Sphagnum jensenii TaxID=128206 RepID=A0ABP1BBK0_9BRYO
MSINMTSGEKNKGLSRDPWSSFTSKTDKNGTKSDQFPADIEEQMQLEFAIWRSGNSTREQVNMHLDERKGLATIVFPEGLSFFVYPLSVCKNVPSSNSNIQQRIHLSEMSYKVQILFLHNHGSVELSPNGSEAGCVIPGLELDLLNNQFVQVCSQPSAEHPMWSMKLIQRPASQKKIRGTLGKKLCVPLLECMKELKTTKNLTQVLEALVPFCSNYGACLQVLSNELDDQHEHNVTDDEAIRDIQMSNLDRELQARVQEQVESTARACQVSAEVVMEISKLGASILTGDEASPRTSYSNAPAATQVMWEALVKNKYLRHSKDLSSSSQGDQNPNAGYEMGGDTDGSERSWQEIAALCRSGNQKAVLEGNVLQWCSVKYLKESCAIQITIDVGAFMEDDLDLWLTGISVYSPLIVKISLKQDWGLTPFTGGYQVDAYQGAHETHDAKPSIAVTCFIPHIVKQYVTNAHKNGTGPKQLSDDGYIIGIMR